MLADKQWGFVYTHIQTKHKLTHKIKPMIGWTNISWHAIISYQLMFFVSVKGLRSQASYYVNLPWSSFLVLHGLRLNRIQVKLTINNKLSKWVLVFFCSEMLWMVKISVINSGPSTCWMLMLYMSLSDFNAADLIWILIWLANLIKLRNHKFNILPPPIIVLINSDIAQDLADWCLFL